MLAAVGGELGAIEDGLEDLLNIGRGQLASSNAAQMHKMRHILEEPGYGIATPEEACAVLDLKSGDMVKFQRMGEVMISANPLMGLRSIRPRNRATPEMMLACGGAIAPWIISVTFGGP